MLVWFQLSLTRSLDSMFCSIRTFCCWIGNQEVVGSNLQSDCFLHFCLNTDTTNNHTSVCNLLLLYHLHTWVDIISGRLSDVWNPNAFVSFRNLSCFSCLIIYFLSMGHSCLHTELDGSGSELRRVLGPTSTCLRFYSFIYLSVLHSNVLLMDTVFYYLRVC